MFNKNNKFGFRKNKAGVLVSCLLGSVIALQAGPIEAQAETVEDKIDENIETETTDLSKEDQVAALDHQINDVEKDLDIVNQEAAKLEEEVNLEKQEISNLENNLKANNEQLEKLSTENEQLNADLEKAEESLEQLKSEKVAEEAKISDLEAKQDENKQKLNEEKAKLSDQQALVADQENNISEKQALVDQRQAELDTLVSSGVGQVITDLKASQAEIKADIANLNQQEADTKAKLESSQATETKLSQDITRANQEINQKNKQLKEIQASKTEADKLLLAQEKELAQLQKELSALPEEDLNKIIVPEGFTIENIKKLREGYLSHEDFDKITQDYSDRKGTKNRFKPRQVDLETNIPDLNQLSEDTRTELSLFAAKLINQVRDAIGTPRVEVGPDAIAFADNIAKRYANDNYTYEQGLADKLSGKSSNGHYDKAISEEAGKVGLYEGGNYYENLSFGAVEYVGHSTDYGKARPENVSLAQIKEAIFTALINMLFDDGNSYYGHTASLAGFNSYETKLANERLAQTILNSAEEYREIDEDWAKEYVKEFENHSLEILNSKNYKELFGIATSDVKADLSYRSRIHFITVSKYQVKDPSKFDHSNVIKPVDLTEQRKQLNSQIVATQNKINTSKSQIKSLEEQINRENTALDQAKTKLQNLEKQEADTKKEISDLQKTLANLAQEKASKEAALQANQERLAYYEGENLKIAAAIKDAEAKLASATADLKLEQEKLSPLLASEASLKAEIAALEKENQQFTDLINATKASIAKIDEEITYIDNLPGLIQINQEESQKLADANVTLNAQLADHRRNLSSLQADLASKLESQAKLESDLEALKTQRDNLQTQIELELAIDQVTGKDSATKPGQSLTKEVSSTAPSQHIDKKDSPTKTSQSQAKVGDPAKLNLSLSKKAGPSKQSQGLIKKDSATEPSQKTLPKTGSQDQVNLSLSASLILLAGLGLVIQPKKSKENI